LIFNIKEEYWRYHGWETVIKKSRIDNNNKQQSLNTTYRIYNPYDLMAKVGTVKIEGKRLKEWQKIKFKPACCHDPEEAVLKRL